MSLKDIFAQGYKFEENILRAFENRKMIFFVGAGVSRIMGIPGWDDLSSKLIKKAFPSYQEQNIILRDIPNSKERITIAYKEFEKNGKLQEFYKIFGEGMSPQKEIFDNTENIYEILNRFDAFFLTTNADNLFEDVLGHAVCHENYDINIIKSEHHRRQNHLFYLHGHYTSDIDPDKNNLVFTATQYVNRYNDQDFVQFLTTIFLEDNVIVFIGYGLNEFELIDYVVTKTGYNEDSPKKVYVLYGFCENDDVLYEAKKSYFDALNIEIIPYNLTQKGYIALIDVLKALYEDYKKKAIIPVSEAISENIKNYNKGNYATILRYLRDPELAHINETQIVREIKQLGTHEWIKQFYVDELFSSSRMDEKISYRAWPLLELFVDWVESDEASAQEAATDFLKRISKKQLDAMVEKPSYINNYIMQIIFALDRNNIKSQYLDILRVIARNDNLYYHELGQITRKDRVINWKKQHKKKLFKTFFEGVNLNAFNDMRFYYIEKFFKQINSLLIGNDNLEFIFNFFVDLLKTETQKGYDMFIHVHSLENIYKNHEEYWKLIFTELKYTFSKLNKKKQRYLISSLLQNSNIKLYKLGLYLSRVFDHNISDLIINSTIWGEYSYFHEAYLLLKQHSEKGYLSETDINELYTIICDTKFGIDEYPDYGKDEYYDNLILSKRLLLLKLFSNDEYTKKATELTKKGIKPYDTIGMAESCDYVHSGHWENDVQFTSEMFQDTELDQWYIEFEKKCKDAEDEISLSDCGRQFARIILDLPKEQADVIIPTLKNLSTSLITSIMYEFGSNKDKLLSTDIVVNTCIDILDEQLGNDVEKDLAKAIFYLMSKINTQNEALVLKTLEHIQPWLEISIDNEATFIGDKHLLNNLINFGNFEKFSVLLNCYVTLKKLNNKNMIAKQKEQIIKLLENDNENKTFKHTLCYYYQSLKYISSDDTTQIFNVMFKDEPFDMTSLMLCVVNSRYLFKEIIEKIKIKYLSGEYSIPEECKDGILPDCFYAYIISARYENGLTQLEFELAYDDYNFLDYFLRSLSVWPEKEGFTLTEILPNCWAYIKAKYNSDDLQKLAELILHSADDVTIPTEALLDLYIDITTSCSKMNWFYIKVEKVLKFFEVNRIKAFQFTKNFFMFDDFIHFDELELVLQKYKSFGISGYREDVYPFLNQLVIDGKINTSQREALAKIFDD